MITEHGIWDVLILVITRRDVQHEKLHTFDGPPLVHAASEKTNHLVFRLWPHDTKLEKLENRVFSARPLACYAMLTSSTATIGVKNCYSKKYLWYQTTESQKQK